MDSLDSFNNFIVRESRLLLILASAISRVGKQYSDVRFVENQVIRNEKINLENFRNRPAHPFFFVFHSENSDSCTPFEFHCREHLDSYLHHNSDSILIPPLLAMLRLFPEFSSRIKSPPKFFLTNFHLYRRLPNIGQWFIFIFLALNYITFKISMSCFSCCFKFWSTVWSGWSWVCCLPFKKICYSSSSRIHHSDPENPQSIRQNGNPSYGAVQSQSTVRSSISIVNENEQSTLPKTVVKSVKTPGNNEERAPTPAIPKAAPNGNNEPAPTNHSILTNALESLKQIPESEKAVTISNEEEGQNNIEKYEKQIGAIAGNGRDGDEFEERKRELNRATREQKEAYDSLKNIEPPSDDYNEEIREMEDKLKRDIAEQERRHKEELEDIRRTRREQQEKAEKEFQKMKHESQQRLAALLLCIQMRIRFEEKEEEWGDFLKGVRNPLTKISTCVFDLQDEIRKSTKNSSDDRENILSEVKFLANLVNTAQNVLANAFYFLEEQSEIYEDRIFLKMIMKSVLTEGQHCDSIGAQLVALSRSPLDTGTQNMCNDALSKLNAHSIQTTQKLKADSVYAMEEEYTGMDRFPEPDWFTLFQN